mmetsp:Transcript_11067/g.19892  ORF Transcript_11067/g.19892 Transcript_11067/m.19892 type:complete len:278 (-) Transcript_11067:110-943(-)
MDSQCSQQFVLVGGLHGGNFSSIRSSDTTTQQQCRQERSNLQDKQLCNSNCKQRGLRWWDSLIQHSFHFESNGHHLKGRRLVSRQHFDERFDFLFDEFQYLARYFQPLQQICRQHGNGQSACHKCQGNERRTHDGVIDESFPKSIQKLRSKTQRFMVTTMLLFVQENGGRRRLVQGWFQWHDLIVRGSLRVHDEFRQVRFVRNQHQGRVFVTVPQGHQLLCHTDGGIVIQSRKGFVQHNDPFVLRQLQCQTHPSAHPTTELCRSFGRIPIVVQSDGL